MEVFYGWRAADTLADWKYSFPAVDNEYCPDFPKYSGIPIR